MNECIAIGLHACPWCRREIYVAEHCWVPHYTQLIDRALNNGASTNFTLKTLVLQAYNNSITVVYGDEHMYYLMATLKYYYPDKVPFVDKLLLLIP
jgi:hypothetical protein